MTSTAAAGRRVSPTARRIANSMIGRRQVGVMLFGAW
jgi:hypothetical protein